MSSKELETILAKLLELLDSKNPTAQGQVIESIAEQYEALVSKYRPLVQLATQGGTKVAGDIALVLTAAVSLANVLAEDPGLWDELKRFRQGAATRRFESLKIYETAGFTRAEAMALVLADIANAKSTRENIFASGRARSSSRD